MKMGYLEFMNMKVVQNRKEWRHSTVMQLIEISKLDAKSAIQEVEELERFIFKNDFIVEVVNEEQKQALESLIKSLV